MRAGAFLGMGDALIADIVEAADSAGAKSPLRLALEAAIASGER